MQEKHGGKPVVAVNATEKQFNWQCFGRYTKSNQCIIYKRFSAFIKIFVFQFVGIQGQWHACTMPYGISLLTVGYWVELNWIEWIQNIH